MPWIFAPNNSDALKSYALSWLLHLVGDVNQPLYCTTRVSAAQPEDGDGGNGVKLTPSPANLHNYYDSVPGTGNAPLTAANATSNLPAAFAGAANDMDVSHPILASVIEEGI